MASKLLHLLAILSFLLALVHSQMSVPSQSLNEPEDEEDGEEYVLDSPFSNTRLRSRFLASVKKGKHCLPGTNSICNGVSANGGTTLLYCCKKHCRNVLADKNHCGGCGNQCRFGHKCCGGSCVDVKWDASNCGKCGRTCGGGKNCEHGDCGYA